jgi:hypothetical protein
VEVTPPLARARGRDALELALALGVSLAHALSFGLNFGVGNQVTYLLPSLRLLDPTLLTRDWFVNQTTQYHLVFAHLGAWLLALDPRGTAVATTFVVVVTGTGLGVYALCRTLAGPRAALPSFFLAMALAFAGRTQGPMTTYVFDGTLQPSTLASAFLVGAATCFAAGRFAWSGAFLGMSGLCHLNLLVLLAPAFGFGQLLLGRAGLVRRLALELGWVALAALPFVPTLLHANAPVPDADFARHIYVAIRAPHHFDLRAHWSEFLPFCAWQVLGAAIVWPLARIPRQASLRRMAALLAGFLAVIWLGTLGALASERVAPLFAWRLVPHATLLLGVSVSTVAVRAVLEPELWALFPRYLGQGARIAVSLRAHPGLVCVACFLLLANSGVGPVRRTRIHSSLLVRPADARSELETWMRERSPKQALFLIPPDEDTLRFWGERAVVVDWKANPAIPSEVLEWYRRIGDVVGRRDVRGARDLDGYAELDTARLAALRTLYGFDFAIVRREHAAPFHAFTRAFENAHYVVLDAGPGAPGH